MGTKLTLPVAEVFTSIHGEGHWAGTLMTFIRLAGCTVGKPMAKGLLPILSTGAQSTMCTTFDGRQFPCDTDYNMTGKWTVEELLMEIPHNVRHVCITGGEPLM